MKYKILIFIVIALGIFLRFYRLPDLISFSYEQALALEASGKMVQTGKISLIGVEYFIRQTSASHSFFNSAAYLYPLSLIQKIFGFDPLAPTILFALLNVIAGIGLYFFVEKYFKKSLGLISLVLYMFYPAMINIGRTVWHIYLLVPIAVLSIWAYYKAFQSLKPAWLILLGFSLGLGFGMHISYLIGIAVMLFVCVYRFYKKHQLINLFFLFIGILIGYSPIILFDLRHNFYNTLTMLTFLHETLTGGKQGPALEGYYFIYLLIPIFIFASVILKKLFSIKLIIPILLLYIAVSSSAWHLSDPYPSGMPKGTNLTAMKYTASLIAKDAPQEYEVASIVDGETRGENLRYLLEYVEKKTPMANDKYPEAKVLYVVSYIDQDPLTKSVWELDSIKPTKISQVWKINDSIKLTKLQKINE